MKKLIVFLYVLAIVPFSVNAQGDNYKHQTGKKKTVKESKEITVTEERNNYKQTFSSDKDSSAEKGIVKTRANKKSYKHQVPQKRN